MTIYLYVKTHNKTGLKYLGQTIKKDPHKYTGSGVYWLNHLRKHGFDYKTEILKECVDLVEVEKWGLYYSELWKVDTSNEWANLVPEAGHAVANHGERNGMYGKKRPRWLVDKMVKASTEKSRNKTYEEIYGEEEAKRLKEIRSKNFAKIDKSFSRNPRYDSTVYTFHNIKTGVVLHCTRLVFMCNSGVNKTGVCDIVNNGKVYKSWCIIF